MECCRRLRYPESLGRFAILKDSARYPSGPRERSAKPPFVGSNPTRASKPDVYAVFREPPGPLRREKGRSRRPSPFVKSIFLAEFLSFRLAIAASPRQAPCKVAQDSGTRSRGPAPGSVGR